MSAHPLYCLEDFQTKLARAQSLARQIQNIALNTDAGDAAHDLDMIDAISEALSHRMSSMIEDAHAAHRQLSHALNSFDALSDAFAEMGGDDDE